MKRAAVLALGLVLFVPSFQVFAEEPAAEEPSTTETEPAAAPEADEFDQFEEMQAGGDPETRPKVYDPLEGFNRAMYHVNDKLYFWMLKPVARGYRLILPRPVRSGIHRMFQNVVFPVRFVNSGLQGKFGGAGREGARFLINSTVGLAGFFDPARHWGIEPSVEDFGQTLGRWGLGAGVPLTLPLIGPTNLRDAVGLVPDHFLNPLSYVDPHDKTLINRTRFWLWFGRTVNETSLDIGKYEGLKKDALDPYTFLRDGYKQLRDQKIKE